MLKRAVDSLNNSIGPNEIIDDKVALNYIALATCIVGIEYQGKVKHPSISQVCSAFKLVHNYDEKIDGKRIKQSLGEEEKIKRHNSRLKFIVENVITNERKECNGVGQVADITGMKDIYVSAYASAERTYKGTWKIYRVNKTSRGTTSSRTIKITNSEIEESIEFKSLKETAEFLEISRSTLIRRINEGKEVSGWKVEYLD